MFGVFVWTLNDVIDVALLVIALLLFIVGIIVELVGIIVECVRQGTKEDDEDADSD